MFQDQHLPPGVRQKDIDVDSSPDFTYCETCNRRIPVANRRVCDDCGVAGCRECIHQCAYGDDFEHDYDCLRDVCDCCEDKDGRCKECAPLARASIPRADVPVGGAGGAV